MVRSIFLAACVALAAAAGCGGGSPNPFEAEELEGFVTNLDVGDEQQQPEQSIAMKASDIPDYVNEGGIARGWRAGHRTQILRPIADFDRILVQAELYADKRDADRRYDGERSSFVTFVEGGFPNTAAETFDVSDIGERCEGFTISHPSYIDQQQVHCQVETVFIMSRTIGEDAERGRELAKEAAAEVMRRAQAALEADGS